MSPTTLRPGARALGALLLTAALAGAPAVASADTATPTPTASATPSASATEPSATPSPTATDTPSAEPTPSQSPSATPSPSTSAPSATASPEASTGTGLVPGGTSGRLGVRAAAGPATSTDPVLVGADYIERELVATDYTLPIVFGGVEYPQYGLVADSVLALDAAGSAQDAATAATAVLAEHVKDYISYVDGDPTTPDEDVYVGPTAKLLNVAIAQRVDPRAFGGFDLVATLQGLEQANGRFTDLSAFGDNSNTFGQSFALIGLTRAGVTVSSQARAYLVTQQCPNGGFKLYESDAGCTTDADADPDATAMAVQALLAVGGSSSAVADGLDYLAGIQDPSGGVRGAGLTATVNANSTGLAGQAFLAGGRTAQARAAVGYLTALQYGCSFPATLRGGVAYDRAAFDAQAAAGGSATPTDQDRRSSSQALLALAGVPLGAVDATGADAQAPSLACASPSPTTTPTTTPTTGGGASATPTPGAPGDSAVDPVAAAPSGALAQTGADPLVPALVGLALLVLGGAAVLASRRRGAHA